MSNHREASTLVKRKCSKFLQISSFFCIQNYTHTQNSLFITKLVKQISR